MKKYHWERTPDACWLCDFGNITLMAVPDSTRRQSMFTRRAASRTLWRAQASIWDEATRTISRYGRDAYQEPCATADEAKKLAEQIYEEASTQK